MPKDAAYYELLVKSRRVRRDTSHSIIVAKPVKIKSEMPQIGSRDFHEKFTGNDYRFAMVPEPECQSGRASVTTPKSSFYSCRRASIGSIWAAR
jgi:hypothetical protein